MAKEKDPKRTVKWQWENNRAAFLTWSFLRLSVFAVLIRSATQGYWDNVFICVLVLLLFQLPSVLERRLKIEFPSGLQIVILVHIYACEILGELACYYVQYTHWDSITHTVWGFLCAAVGYALVDILNRKEPTHFYLSPAYLAVASFCFSMTIGVFWEFFEFAADRLLMIDMQKDTVITTFASTLLDTTRSNIPVRLQGITDVAVNGSSLGVAGYLDIGLYDTMEDLFVNAIGALVFSFIGYFRSRSGNAGRIAAAFIPKTLDEKADATDSGQRPENPQGAE